MSILCNACQVYFIEQAVLIVSKIETIWDLIQKHCYWIEWCGDKAAIAATACTAMFTAHSIASIICD
jgi:hypothetical protein